MGERVTNVDIIVSVSCFQINQEVTSDQCCVVIIRNRGCRGKITSAEGQATFCFLFRVPYVDEWGQG